MGFRITGLIARIFMVRWARKMKETMDENLIHWFNFMKYVNDINICENIGKRTRENGTRLEWRESWEVEDEKEGKLDERVTMNALLEMANQIAPCHKFLSDLPEDHDDKRCP